MRKYAVLPEGLALRSYPVVSGGLAIGRIADPAPIFQRAQSISEPCHQNTPTPIVYLPMPFGTLHLHQTAASFRTGRDHIMI